MMTCSCTTVKEAARFFSAAAIEEGFIKQALHAYTDLAGNVLYWRIRLKHPDGRKWIRPLYQDANGQFHLAEPPSLQGKPKPLYGLHWLAENPQAAILIVEGEYPADVINRFLGQQNATASLIAITSGSTSTADKADWQPLSGKPCLLWPDNDLVGKKYMEVVYSKLALLHCPLEVIEIEALNLPPSGDVVDWLHTHPSVSAADLFSLPTIAHPAKKMDGSPGEKQEPEEIIISQLATLSTLEYERVRDAKAKALGIRPAILDRLVKAAQASPQHDNIEPFAVIKPWHEPIHLASLLTDIAHTIQRFIACEPETAYAATLWIAMTWVIDVVRVSPLAVITAPEKRCGKSQLLSVMRQLVNRPLIISNITPAALFRAMDTWHPTLLVDEVDAFMRDNNELRGLLNAGHMRDAAYAIRVELHLSLIANLLEKGSPPDESPQVFH